MPLRLPVYPGCKSRTRTFWTIRAKALRVKCPRECCAQEHRPTNNSQRPWKGLDKHMEGGEYFRTICGPLANHHSLLSPKPEMLTPSGTENHRGKQAGWVPGSRLGREPRTKFRDREQAVRKYLGKLLQPSFIIKNTVILFMSKYS